MRVRTPSMATFRSPSSLQDLFILGAAMLAAFIFTLEYDLIQSGDVMSPHERRITLGEIFLLGGALIVGLLIFSARRMSEQRVEFGRRIQAENVAREACDEAQTDQLTGLHNRRGFYAVLDRCLVQETVRSDTHALILVDLDRFKAINDKYGHPTGDMVLESIGRRLQTLASDRRIAARLGGDEFAFFVTFVTPADDVTDLARNIVSAIERPIAVDGRMHSIGASVGIAFFPTDALDRADLMRQADLALYRAKEAGSSEIRLYSSIAAE